MIALANDTKKKPFKRRGSLKERKAVKRGKWSLVPVGQRPFIILNKSNSQYKRFNRPDCNNTPYGLTVVKIFPENPALPRKTHFTMASAFSKRSLLISIFADSAAAVFLASSRLVGLPTCTTATMPMVRCTWHTTK